MNWQVFDDFPDGLVVLTEKRIVEYINESALAAFGFSSRRQLLNKSISERFKAIGNYLNREISDDFSFTEISLDPEPDKKPITLFVGAKFLEGGQHILLYVRDISVEVNLLNKFRREKKEKELAIEISLTDALTQCYNKEGLYQEVDKTWGRIQRHGGVFAIFVIDLDDFKNVNDNYGHQAGDDYLVEFAILLRKAFRERDIIGRFGGDEFVVVVKDCDRQDATAVAERLLKKVRAFQFRTDNATINISLSLGICVYDKTFDQWQDMLKAADDAVYLAKNAGKNSYFFHGNKPA